MVLPAVAGYTEAVDWFAAEITALLAAARIAFDQGAFVHAWMIPWALTDFLHLHGRWQDWADCHTTALQAARVLADVAAENRVLQSLARAYAEIGEPAKSAECYSAALENYRRCGDTHGEANCLNGRAGSHLYAGRPEEACDDATAALRIYTARADLAGQASTVNLLGRVRTAQGSLAAGSCCTPRRSGSSGGSATATARRRRSTRWASRCPRRDDTGSRSSATGGPSSSTRSWGAPSTWPARGGRTGAGGCAVNMLFLSAEASDGELVSALNLVVVVLLPVVAAAALYWSGSREEVGSQRDLRRRLGHVATGVALAGAWLSGVVFDVVVALDDVPVRSTVLLTILGGGVLAVPLLVLTTRPRRTREVGSRSHWMPFLSIGKALTLAVPVGLAVIHLTGGAHVFAVPFIVLASLFLDAALRKDKAEAERDVVLQAGAVVYIRGFRRELDLFAHTSADHGVNTGLGITYKPNRFRCGRASFAEFLEPTASELLGRWQHMGNLHDRLPLHGGTAAYTADKEWREQFAWLVEHSRCVITFPHPYRQLSYELAVIRKAGAHTRLFLLTSPESPSRRSALHARRWAAFAAAAAQPHKDFGLGGYTLEDNPGPGAVVAFDDDCKAVVLCRNAKTPADYAQVVRARLEATRNVGNQQQPWAEVEPVVVCDERRTKGEAGTKSHRVGLRSGVA
ncbi:tetratricopeptide repeat protein [Lentzea chajnantorensis]